MANNLASDPYATPAAFGAGGGIYAKMYGNTLKLTSCTITNNTIQNNSVAARDGAYGSGICLGRHRDTPGIVKADIVNCTIAYNATEGIDVESASSLKLLNSIIYFNAEGGAQIVGVVTPTYCDVQTVMVGTGNIFRVPMFQSAVDVRVIQGSPCIDGGNPASQYNDVLFPPSMNGVRNDIGVDGGPGAALGVGPGQQDKDTDGLPDAWEIKYFGNISAYRPNDDPDGDRLINSEEYAYNTDPAKKDTDGDGYSDFGEIAAGSDPLDPKSVPPPELTLTVQQVKLQFLPAQGQANLIQASADLANWITVEEVAGTGDIVARTYGVTNGFRFFRLLRP